MAVGSSDQKLFYLISPFRNHAIGIEQRGKGKSDTPMQPRRNGHSVGLETGSWYPSQTIAA